MPTTAPPLAVTAPAATPRTLLQIKTFNEVEIAAWGVSFNGSAAAVPVVCELIDTGTVFATVTTLADADVPKFDRSGQAVASTAGLTFGTAATGFTATAEGSIVAVKTFDVEFVAPTNQYVMQFPLGERPIIIPGNCGRIRVTAPVAVAAYCWMLLKI